ncbi:MAG: peptidase M48, partial [Pseudomonadota bacterium]
RQAVFHDRLNPFAWYQLGIAYAKQGDEPRAALAAAERYSMGRQPKLAMVSAKTAMAGLPRGSPDWLRAQDVFLVSQTAVEKDD